MIVYKYPLPIEAEGFIEMPAGAKILSVQAQRGIPMVWALVDPTTKALAKHWFFVFGTGTPIDFDLGDASFLGTFQLEDGLVMVHVWDNGETVTHAKSVDRP